MTTDPRIPALEPTGPLGIVIRMAARSTLGRVPRSVGVWWNHRRVMTAMAAMGRRVSRWDVCDPGLVILARIAVSSRVGCGWCLDFAQYEAHDRHLDMEKAAAVPRWQSSSLFTPVERAVIEYAEAMTATPPTVTDDMVATLRPHLGDDGVVEITAVIAYTNLTARSNVALGISPDGFAASCGLAPLAAAGQQ